MWHSLAVTASIACGLAQTRPDYILGPDDQVTLRSPEAEEISGKPFVVGSNGTISVPLVGNVKAAGLTPGALEAELNQKLRRYIHDPQLSVTVTEYRSQPVTVLGAVQSPGQQQLRGSRSLMEVLSMAGGLRPDAGNSIRITRRKEMGPIPVENARLDETGCYVGEIRIKTLLDASSPKDNIAIQPQDVISVPKGDIIYVVGTVRKSGGYVVGERSHLTVLEAVAMAEGLERFADTRRTKILRTQPGQDEREEIAVDLEDLLRGKGRDVALRPDDILFIPANRTKSATVRTLETALGVGGNIASGLVIYRR